MLLSSLQKLTINNYKTTTLTQITNTKIFDNILFLKQHTNKSLTQIINDPNNYANIKLLLFNILPINQTKYINAFNDLENNGLNSFKPYNSLSDNIKTIITTKYNFLLKDKHLFPYFKICSKTQSSLFTKSSATIINNNVLEFLELINGDLFVPYRIFNDDDITNIIMYQTNTQIKNILLASNKYKSLLTQIQLQSLLKLSITLITSLSQFLNININNLSIDLILYMSNAKKICPKIKNQTISYEHVNSGSTTSYHDSNYADPLVKIYRSEELIKVLFHELIHACKFENIFDKYPPHKFKVTRAQLLFTESITECMARILNIILYSYIYNKNINETLEYEIMFGLIQTAKILNTYGFVSVKDFLNDDINDKRKIKQETSAFEYYILTTILLMNVNNFFNIIERKGTIHDMVKLVNDAFNNIDYQNRVDNIIDDLGNMDSDLLNTCKMTVIKINLNDI
jgi:hypothetical protein